MKQQETVGERLRAIREVKHLSLSQASRLTSENGKPIVHDAAISRIERNERYPTLRSLEGLTRAYGVRIVIEGGQTTVEA